jgi:hypothetical protein
MLLAMGKANLLCRSPRQVSRLAAPSRRLRLCWIFLLRLPVKAGMNVGSVSQLDKRKRLRSAYDHSWSRFSLAVSVWQSLHDRTSPGTVSIIDAERAVSWRRVSTNKRGTHLPITCYEKRHHAETDDSEFKAELPDVFASLE